jgi:hypothetical protein
MPIKVIHGKYDGPCMVVFSVINGTELNGLEIANRLIGEISADNLSGTLIAIPVLNVYGLTHYPLPLPAGNSLSECFPGEEAGNFGERMAYLFTEEILKKTDYCIELQTGGINHNILPQVYCNFAYPESKKLARVFNAPVITNVKIKGNKFRQTTEQLNIPLLVYQAGEAMRFDEGAINLGVEGVKNVMHSLKMIQDKPTEMHSTIFSMEEDWIRAHKGGILHTEISLGQSIKKKDRIATISDPFGVDVLESVKSDKDGIVVGINTSPLIHEGMQIFKIASFIDDDKAETIITPLVSNFCTIA